MIILELGSDRYSIYDSYYSYHVWKDNHCVFGKTYTDGCWVTKYRKMSTDLKHKTQQAFKMAERITGLAPEELRELIDKINKGYGTFHVSNSKVEFYLGGKSWTFHHGMDKGNSSLRALLIKEGLVKDSQCQIQPVKASTAPRDTSGDSPKGLHKQTVGVYTSHGVPLEQVDEFHEFVKANGKGLMGVRLNAQVETFLELSPIQRQSTVTVRDAAQQADFRQRVKENYNGVCCVTGATSLVCDAAHLKPFSEFGGYEVSNGLFLRADLHRLLDKGHMAIDPADSYRVHFSHEAPEYLDLECYLSIGHIMPDWETLMAGWEKFKKRWNVKDFE